ncbi:hypothetical protein EYZ11_012842 [Aspergillus tanneri]|uniref:Uncharacterized protein n=1 Tax=Aspergillus tanneri TaxID=1220188 RepID=A0A4V3UML1_9EURO|nr:hypothetical protein EYZ11_012842 [Aspergillus tanneri]
MVILIQSWRGIAAILTTTELGSPMRFK